MWPSRATVICHNKTLVQLVRLLPAKTSELHRVWGIGAKRVAQHGALMLQALAPFRAALLARRSPPPPPPPAAAHSQTKAKTRPTEADSPAAGATSTEERSRRGGGRGGGAAAAAWRDDTGTDLASQAWVDGAESNGWPASDWAARRHWCAERNECPACAGYVADGEAFKWAVMSQKLLDALASPHAYGSHREAHAAGWRWNPSPNRNQRSHNHQWWPPQSAIDEHLEEDARLPIGTMKAFEVLEAMF